MLRRLGVQALEFTAFFPWVHAQRTWQREASLQSQLQSLWPGTTFPGVSTAGSVLRVLWAAQEPVHHNSLSDSPI